MVQNKYTDTRVQLTCGLNVSLNMKYVFGKSQYIGAANRGN